MTTLPPWDPDEYDRQVKAGRERERRERSPRGPVLFSRPEQQRFESAVTRYIAELPTIGPMGGRPRRRPTVQASASSPPTPPRRRRPKAKALDSGRWRGRIKVDGRRRTATFETEQEASTLR